MNINMGDLLSKELREEENAKKLEQILEKKYGKIKATVLKTQPFALQEHICILHTFLNPCHSFFYNWIKSLFLRPHVPLLREVFFNGQH